MKSDQTASANGQTLRSSHDSASDPAPDGLQATRRWRRHQLVAPRPHADVDGGEPAEVAIPLGMQAPGVARRFTARLLADEVAPSVLEGALLLVSELVTNSLRHSGVAEGDDIVLRVLLWHDGFRLEVEDPGRGGVIAPRPPDRLRGGGLGLHLVQTLSERWGVMRAPEGPTCVWAQLPRSHHPEASEQESDPCDD